MKTIKNVSLMKNVQYIILSALLLVCGNVMGDAYKTLTFPDDNSDNNKKQNYTSTWTAKKGTDEWSISNFNNNQWSGGWKYIKCGRDGSASVASIVSPQMAVKIETVTLTIDAITVSKVNSIKLYTSTNKSSWTEVGTYSKATGEQSVTIASNQQAANLYYKAEFDCASGSSNGLVQISKVEYFEVQTVCQNPITIAKGSTSYGTFNLSNTGEQCGDGDGVTCQLTDITPNQNWYADHVETESGIASAIVDGSATVSGIKESTTITVVFLEKAKATLRISDAGDVTTLTTGAEYQGDQVTLPSTASEHDGYILVGWSETPIINATSKPENIYPKGATFALTKTDQTLYAVFGKGTEGNNDVIWSENFGDQLIDNESFSADYTGFSGKGSLTYAGSHINLSKKTGGKEGCAVHTNAIGTGTFTVSGLNTSGYESFVLSYWVNASGTSGNFYHSVKVDNDNNKVYNTETTPATTQSYQEFTCTQIPAKEGLSLQFSFGVSNVSGAHLDEITLIGKNPDNITEWTTNFITYQDFAYKCTYDIYYTLGDGHAWATDYEAPATYDHNLHGDPITLPIGDNLVDGTYFRGWYDNAELTGDPITELAVSGNGDTTLYAAWASVVNFHVQGEIATTQTIDNDGHVAGYTPTATCTGKKFMGWSTVNQTELIQDPASLELFTDFSDKEFTASTDLYAVYAAYNGGKPSETEYHKENYFTTEEQQNFWNTSENASITGSNVYSAPGCASLKMPRNSTDEVYITTKEKIENLSKISFWIKKTGGANNKFAAQFSTNGTEWTDMAIANKPTGASFEYTEVEATMPSVQSAYVRIVAQPFNYGSDYYFYVDDVTFYYKPAQYWYSDYSTNCTMAASAAINYMLGIEEQQYTKVSGENVGATISITDRAPQGYHMYSLEIEGQTYNLGDTYILAHDVLATNVDIRPVITWTERYAGTWSQTNTPIDGKLVLPETQPASFAPGLYEFDGWTAEVFSTETKTVAPTYVTAETDAPATPTTYYAVYRKQNNTGEGYTYRQTTPSSLYKLTYSPNGGVGEDYVTYTDLSTATTPASNLFTREGATLVGWTLEPNAETIEYVGTSTQISGIDGDLHYYAVWIGELAMDKTIALTSAPGATVGSATFTLSSKNLGTITALRFSYKDVDNNITYSSSNRTSSEFRLCNESYTLAEDNLDVSTISTNFSHTYTITYAPNSGHKMSHYKLVVELLNKSKVMATQEFDLTGRSLPDQFVIATQKNGQWYALQANMTSSKGWAGVPIDVKDGWAFASDTLLYSLRTYNNDKTHVLFQSAYKQGHLWAASGSETGIRNYATTISSENNPYAWLLTSENDLLSYTIRNKQEKTDHQYLGMYGTDMGMYQLLTPMQFYFLPLAQEMSIGEWYSDKLLFGEPEQLTDISVKLNGVSQDESISVSRKTYSDTYNLYELSGINFAEAAGQTMLITKTVKSGTKCYSTITVPTFVMTETAVSTLTDGVDVVVRDGGTLNIDANKPLGQLTICPNSKVIVPEGITLTVDSLIFFGGIEDEYKYGVPELVLNGTLVSNADSIMYRMRVDAEQMYTVAFPYNVQVKDITRPDGLAIRDGEKNWTGSLWMDTYNGANRAKGGRRDNDDLDSWKSDADLGETLLAGMGYTVSAPRLRAKSKYAYSLIDFPMAIPMPELSEGPATIEAELANAKGNVPVVAYKNDVDGANNKTDCGWNLLANPYMSTISGANYKIQVSGASENYDVVTMLTDDGEQYYQFVFNETSEALRPFKHFFLQVGEDGTFSFSPNLAASAPRYLAAQEQGSADFALTISGDNSADISYFRINNRYTDEYEIGADVVKMCSAQTQLYSLFGEEGLFRIATAAADNTKLIPLGYQTDAAGKFTITMAANAAVNNVDYIYLLENGQAVADLMREGYTFETGAGSHNDRFAILVVLGSGQAPTNIFGIDDDGGGGPQKIIHNSLMYILMPDGRVYDAAGDQVNRKEVTK